MNEEPTPDLPAGSPEAALSGVIEEWWQARFGSEPPFCVDGAALSILGGLSLRDFHLLKIIPAKP